ncbi:glycosyltransferase family 2 protein [Scandinavium sp. M-37]|uniref:glycosyltransferase family 2 protein n=1 Tax=Scandinavium sp. M-37 TaxID=3373077 RepID=UPI003745DB15
MSNAVGKLDIVLATYNGAKYLSEQLNSILMMDCFDELVNSIIVCDDNSSDNTLDIIKEIIPINKLVLIKNEQGKPYGPAKNFERGIALSTSEYIMLSDQDDVWGKNKLVRYLEVAGKCDSGIPLIVFSDLEIVDANLNTIDKSFLNYQSINSDWINKLDHLLIQNLAPGCTMLFNKKLIEKSLPFPDDCLMHDWWLMLVCKLYGNIRFIEKETFIKYRQHGNNQVGAKRNSFLVVFAKFKKSFEIAKVNYHRTVKQMLDFKRRFNDDIPEENIKFINALALYLSPDISSAQRLYAALTVKLRKSSFLKTLGTYFVIFKGLGR